MEPIGGRFETPQPRDTRRRFRAEETDVVPRAFTTTSPIELPPCADLIRLSLILRNANREDVTSRLHEARHFGADGRRRRASIAPGHGTGLALAGREPYSLLMPDAKPAEPTFFDRLVNHKLLFWATLLIGLIADIQTKAWAQSKFMPRNWTPDSPLDTPVHPLIDGFLAWKWAVNIGAAFSILSGQVHLLSLIALVVVGALVVYAFRMKPEKRIILAALGLVAAGALGNLYDRVSMGYVRDFIYFDFDLPLENLHGYRRWPVFNVADILVFCGVFVLIVDSFFARPETKPDKKT
jgi:signal peptidase II